MTARSGWARRQVLCQFFGRRRLCADSDRRSQLARLIDWPLFEARFGALYVEGAGRGCRPG